MRLRDSLVGVGVSELIGAEHGSPRGHFTGKPFGVDKSGVLYTRIVELN